MRNKNTVVLLLGIFTLICCYNLFYTYRAFSMDAELNALEKPQADSLRADENFAEAYKKAHDNAFSLGLDLQGGLFVTMEISVEDILREYAGSNVDKLFEDAMKSANDIKETSQESLVDLFYQELQKTYQSAGATIPKDNSGNQLLLARYFSSNEREIAPNMSDDDVLERLQTDSKQAIKNSYNIIRTRVDQFGVASPTLSLVEGAGRILLELPGVKDPDRVKKLLSGTAKLEFRETKNLGEIVNVLQRIDRKVKTLKSGQTEEKPAATPAPVAAKPDSVKLDSLGNPIEVADNGADTEEGTEGVTVDDVFKNTNPLASTEGETTADGEAAPALTDADRPFTSLFEQVQLDPSRPVVGYCKVSDTAKVNKWLRHPEVQKVISRDLKFLWEAKPGKTADGKQGTTLGLIAINAGNKGKAPLEGDVIVRASQDYDPNNGSAIVNMKMNSEGGKEWARITKNNVGRCVAIVLDDYVQSFPTVNGMIPSGSSQISGNFTIEEAQDLANLLKAGALPVRALYKGHEEIGPSLGAENLDRGLFSFLIAFLATIGFMVFYYRSSGLIANVALLVNLFYILGVSAAMGVVFTLPGLAAVVLTMGMAVDANVLIFERIREEQLAGKSFKAAIASGFSNAFSSVMDANITTFLTGLILFSFGLGPIKGFAVSLMIGIVTSLISALFITRLILDYYANKGKDSIAFGSKSTLSAFRGIDMKMTVRKKTMYMVSGVLVVASIISFFTFGFRTGVDFQGGRQYTVEFNKEVETKDVREGLKTAFGETPLVRSIDGKNQLLITTSYLVNEDDQDSTVKALVMATLESAASGSEPKIVKETRVGPTVAEDIRNSAIYSVIFSLLVIFLYILIRFRKFQYSVGALAALFHDVIIVMGIFSLMGGLDILPFSLEIDQAFIAAVLTIVGYSINDTVVVFDRIRENFGEMKSETISTVYNLSINQTISRTLITSLTTLITVLILFIFAGDVIRGFMFALLVGIVVGTYSSIFVASPISHDMIRASEGDTIGKKKS